ncbi:MAG: hypothetical protein AAF806_09335 [Bacteroidota bacterium]
MTFLKILLRSNLFLKPYQSEQNRCVILGNGPSAKETLKTYKDFLGNQVLISVNRFPETAAFLELQPQHFVLVAKNWKDNVSEHSKKISIDLYDSVIERTTWEMCVHLPAEAKKCKWLMERFKQNKHLTICLYNDTPVEGISKWNQFFFKKAWGLPRPHNVMIPSLMIAINAGFKEIILVGADHSWLEGLTVNDKNETLLFQKHFYDEDTAKLDHMLKLGKRPRRLHEILEKFMLAFKAYFVIKDYAKSKSVKIWNATPKSFIDAFERKGISDFSKREL